MGSPTLKTHGSCSAAGTQTLKLQLHVSTDVHWEVWKSGVGESAERSRWPHSLTLRSWPSGWLLNFTKTHLTVDCGICRREQIVAVTVSCYSTTLKLSVLVWMIRHKCLERHSQVHTPVTPHLKIKGGPRFFHPYSTCSTVNSVQYFSH